MKNILQSQGFEVEPTSGSYPVGEFEPRLKFDINMDHFRKQPKRGKNHIMVSMMNQFGAKIDHRQPWLKLPKVETNWKYTLIHLTERWRDNSTVDWKKVYNSIKGEKYFIGLKPEWEQFQELYGKIEWMMTSDVYQMAIAIDSAQAVYCNQSVALTLAQGLNKIRYVEFKPGKTNTRFFTNNEHAL
ncbi:MAG: hypothetical protein ACTHMM_10005 [Agriterribacter sp.]